MHQKPLVGWSRWGTHSTPHTPRWIGEGPGEVCRRGERERGGRDERGIGGKEREGRERKGRSGRYERREGEYIPIQFTTPIRNPRSAPEIHNDRRACTTVFGDSRIYELYDGFTQDIVIHVLFLARDAFGERIVALLP